MCSSVFWERILHTKRESDSAPSTHLTACQRPCVASPFANAEMNNMQMGRQKRSLEKDGD